MTSIDPTSRMLAYLRQQAQAWRREHPAPPGRAAGGASARRTAPEHDPFDVAVQQVVHIDPQDPDARRQAFRIYLAAVLMREFGPDVANDPGFGGLVDRVRNTMEADPDLKDAIRQAGELLLKAARAA